MEHCLIVCTPVHLRLSLGTQTADLAWVETVASDLYLLTLSGVAAIGPGVYAWIIEACILELRAVDRDLAPILGVSVVSAVVIILCTRRMENLLPLEHLYFPLKSIGVLGDHAEVTILQVHFVRGRARYVDQLVLVISLRPACIRVNAEISRFVS